MRLKSIVAKNILTRFIKSGDKVVALASFADRFTKGNIYIVDFVDTIDKTIDVHDDANKPNGWCYTLFKKVEK